MKIELIRNCYCDITNAKHYMVEIRVWFLVYHLHLIDRDNGTTNIGISRLFKNRYKNMICKSYNGCCEKE